MSLALVGTVTYGQQRLLLNQLSLFNNFVEINKEDFGKIFPESYSVFASKSDEASNDDVPVFLDLAGTESDFIPSALSRCLKLTKETILEKEKTKKV